LRLQNTTHVVVFCNRVAPPPMNSLAGGRRGGSVPGLHSTRAELLRPLGRDEEARADYRRARQLERTEPERRFQQRRLADLWADLWVDL
jgi:hypothetical protein